METDFYATLAAAAYLSLFWQLGPVVVLTIAR
jgi:hypothetical protein